MLASRTRPFTVHGATSKALCGQRARGAGTSPRAASKAESRKKLYMLHLSLTICVASGSEYIFGCTVPTSRSTTTSLGSGMRRMGVHCYRIDGAIYDDVAHMDALWTQLPGHALCESPKCMLGTRKRAETARATHARSRPCEDDGSSLPLHHPFGALPPADEAA